MSKREIEISLDQTLVARNTLVMLELGAVPKITHFEESTTNTSRRNPSPSVGIQGCHGRLNDHIVASFLLWLRARHFDGPLHASLTKEISSARGYVLKLVFDSTSPVQ